MDDAEYHRAQAADYRNRAALQRSMGDHAINPPWLEEQADIHEALSGKAERLAQSIARLERHHG